MKKEKEGSANRLNIDILYEDDDILAVNKPAGLIVHGDGRREEFTLVDWLLLKYPEISGVGENMITPEGKEVDRSGIVHRIDRETSGVLLVAKNNKAHSHLKNQFQKRKIKKIYNAFVYGKLEKEFGTIDRPIGRSRGDFRQYTSPKKVRGEMREAVTHYKVLKSSPKFSFMEFMPETGRTHQIRAHAKSIGHPIVCDRIYALSYPCALGFKRLALHARSLVFKDLEGKQTAVEAPFPKDFKEALKEVAGENSKVVNKKRP